MIVEYLHIRPSGTERKYEYDDFEVWVVPLAFVPILAMCLCRPLHPGEARKEGVASPRINP